MGRIDVIVADITTLDVDAIVNAANELLLGGGGVDGAIHQAADPELLAACKQLNGCGTGEAKITPGYSLPAKWVIHTVGPVWHGGSSNEPVLLASCYQEVCKLAKLYQIKTIAFPGISTGIYNFPKQKAAKIAITALSQWLPDFEQILCCCFSDQDRLLYEAVLKN